MKIYIDNLNPNNISFEYLNSNFSLFKKYKLYICKGLIDYKFDIESEIMYENTIEENKYIIERILTIQNYYKTHSAIIDMSDNNFTKISSGIHPNIQNSIVIDVFEYALDENINVILENQSNNNMNFYFNVHSRDIDMIIIQEKINHFLDKIF